MNCKPKFFYESGAGNEGGGSATDTLEEVKTGEGQEGQQQQQAPLTEISKPLFSDDELKTFGFNSPDELKNFLSKRNEENIPEEIKKARENEEKASFLKFALDSKDEKGNSILNVDEYNQYENLKAKADRDLVFENYLEDFKKEHTEITDPEELKEAAEEEFNFDYKLNGKSEAEIKRAETKLAREAKELRSPIENKVVAAQNQFKETQNLKQTYPKFDKFVDELITKSTPDKLPVVKVKNGDKEIDVEISITKEDREALAKSFKTPKSFRTFLDSKPEEVTAKMQDKISGWVAKNKQAEIAAKAFELGQGVGRATSSTIGANNPFALVNTPPARVSGEKTLEESNKELAEIRRQEQLRR